MARIAVDHSPHLRIVQSEAPWLDDVPPFEPPDDEPPRFPEDLEPPLSNGHDELFAKAAVLRVRAGELPAAVAQANTFLAEHSRSLFILGDLLVTVEEVDGRVLTVPANVTRIGLEMARVATFQRPVKGKGGIEWRECDPPSHVVAALASEPGGWCSPFLTGLTEVPILRPDGSVVTEPGYDPESRLYLHGGPFAPLDDDPVAALKMLKGAIAEFPFVRDCHRSAALSLLLTSVCRRTLCAAPLFGISAREAGTGKGALASLAAIVATGRRSPETPWPGDDNEEQRKSITATLMSGGPILILDNITEPIDSAALCLLLTAELWNDRLLGFNRRINLPTSVLTIATGNNLQVVGDLCRRVLPVEMDARCESPELRRFERELIPWATLHRQELVAAALTILSSYIGAGSPLPDHFSPLGSFEEWSRLICGALVWLGQPDPRDAMAESRASDPKRVLLTKVLTGLKAKFGCETFQSVGSIYSTAKDARETDAADLWEAIEEITVKARDDKGARIRLGLWFESQKGRVVAGLRLEQQQNLHTKGSLWRAIPA